MSFIFKSEDEEDGKSRIRRFYVELISYFLDKTKNNKTKAHKLIGISMRCLQNKVSEFPELTKYRNDPSINECAKYTNHYKPHLWRKKNGNEGI